MAENAVPGKGVISFGKKPDSSYAPLSLASDGSVNISGSITASLGAFNPLGKAALSVTTATGRVALPTADKGLVLRNTGSNDAWFKLGSGSVTAATTDFLIKAGDILGLDATGFTYVAGITASGTTNFDVWTGTGLISAAQAGGSGGGGGNVNLNQVGGVAIALGQTTKSGSIPFTLASDQGNLPSNVTQVGGVALALGQTTKSASVPVTIANDQGALPTTLSDRLEVTGTISSAAVFSNFPVTDTSGYRCLSLQVTAIAAGSTIVAEESNDGTSWTNLTSIAGASSVTATGLHAYNFSAKQVRVRQSVYGGSGSSSVTAELRLDPLPLPVAYGAGATDARTNRVVLASDDPAVTGIGAVGDTAWVSGNGSIIAILKGIFGKLAGTLTVSGAVTANAGTNLNTSALATESGGNLAAINTATGAQADAAWASGSGSIIAILKNIATKLAGSVAVTGTFWQATQPVSGTVTANGAVVTPVLVDALSTTVKSVLASAAAKLASYYCYNPNAAVAYVQIFDIATTGAVTLGTTVPKWSIAIPAGSAANLSNLDLNFASGIQVAATTTAKGSTAPATALDCNFGYR